MARATTSAWNATPFVPNTTSIAALADAAQECKGCPLWEAATQAVFGEGPRPATMMLVGEQPGDQEDRGKRRIHKKPSTAEIEACHPWIDAELRAVRPAVLVVLGATAARSLLGRSVPIAASRGTRFDVGGVPAVVTYHPSAVLRADDRAAEIRAAIVEDLRLAQRWTTP